MKQSSIARCAVAATFVLEYMALSFADGAQVNATSINGVSSYKASSNPACLAVSLVILAVYIWVVCLPPNAGRPFVTAGIWRRFWAWLADVFIGLFVLTPWSGLIALLVEAAHTGHFAWSVQRQPALDGDMALGVMLVLPAMALLLAYFALPLTRQRATPGSLLLGIAVRYDSGRPPSFWGAMGRVFLAYIALCGWFISVPMALFNPEKRMWQDKTFGTRVVRWTD